MVQLQGQSENDQANLIFGHLPNNSCLSIFASVPEGTTVAVVLKSIEMPCLANLVLDKPFEKPYSLYQYPEGVWSTMMFSFASVILVLVLVVLILIESPIAVGRQIANVRVEER